MKRYISISVAVATCVFAFAVLSNGEAGTLDIVRKRDALNCGVNAGLPGFSQSDGQGNWRGLDVDYCRAIAAAVLADATKVIFIPTPRVKRSAMLQSNEIDVLIRNTTWTGTREAVSNLAFTGVNYFDGQGFMTKASRDRKSVKDLDGTAICVGAGTTSETNLADYFRSHGMNFTAMKFDDHDSTVQAYLADRCDAYESRRPGGRPTSLPYPFRC
jgi:general L-amino acid transport system substrate-binding protein